MQWLYVSKALFDTTAAKSPVVASDSECLAHPADVTGRDKEEDSIFTTLQMMEWTTATWTLALPMAS
eukprot:1341896-Pyramimonas_sp.AAC.1